MPFDDTECPFDDEVCIFAEEGRFYMGNGRWNVACSGDPDNCPFHRLEDEFS